MDPNDPNDVKEVAEAIPLKPLEFNFWLILKFVVLLIVGDLATYGAINPVSLSLANHLEVTGRLATARFGTADDANWRAIIEFLGILADSILHN